MHLRGPGLRLHTKLYDFFNVAQRPPKNCLAADQYTHHTQQSSHAETFSW